MQNYKNLLALFFLVFSLNAQATAPRIAAQLFGEETRADIVGYQAYEPVEKADAQLAVQIVNAAFAAVGKTQSVDLLPSRQLAKYALTNGDALALMVRGGDMRPAELASYHVVTFYLTGVAGKEDVISLIINKNKLGGELRRAFDQGLGKLIRSGKYQELLEVQYGKGQVPAGYFIRLKQHNSALK